MASNVPLLSSVRRLATLLCDQAVSIASNGKGQVGGGPSGQGAELLMPDCTTLQSKENKMMDKNSFQTFPRTERRQKNGGKNCRIPRPDHNGSPGNLETG